MMNLFTCCSVQFLFMDFTICEEACYSYSLLSDLLFFLLFDYMSVSMFVEPYRYHFMPALYGQFSCSSTTVFVESAKQDQT